MEIDRLTYYLGQRLSNLTSFGVYNSKAADTATFPYLTFKLNSSNNSRRHRKDWILEIDYWNDSSNSGVLLEESVNVKNGVDSVIGLHCSTQDEAEGFYQCHIDFEADLTELEEGNISRFNQRYIIKVD